MKLLTKTSLLYLLITTVVFLGGGIIFYHNLHNIIDEETDEHLVFEKARIEDYIRKHDTLPESKITSYDFYSVKRTTATFAEFVQDTSIYVAEEEEMIPFRQLAFPVRIKNQPYSVVVSKSLFESDDLVETIFYSLAIIVVILLAVTLTVNRFVVGKLWKPFFKSVKKLRDYRVNQEKPLQFEKVNTTEFSELNAALEEMTQKIAADYRNLKSFTENASHELQTPLSVIMNSTELLLQQEQMNKEQVEIAQRVYNAAARLSKLNQALLLLAKIENRQFVEKENVDVSKLLGSKLDFYSELIAHKEIQLEKNLAIPVTIALHPALADMLVSNLLTNAIRHTIKGGKIKVSTGENSFTVSNSGEPLQSPEKMFQRFYKENISSESTGLGLALVKEISDTNGLKIEYSYREGMHIFRCIVL